MNTLKHMEAVFLVTLAVAGTAAFSVDTIPDANAAARPTAAAALPWKDVPVVVVSARRMTDAEKAASLAEEARLGGKDVADR